MGDEYGWKQVHGDVFRPPEYTTLFTSVVGTGHQLAVVALGCILIALMEHLYTESVGLICSSKSTYMYMYMHVQPLWFTMCI